MMKLVLGGGLGGLSAAHYLAESGIHLVEKSSRIGGWVRTIKDPVTGLLLETGPHTVRPAGKAGINTLDLLAELDLTEDVVPILNNHPAATRRLLCVGSRLHPLPSSFSSLFKILPPFSKPFAFSLIKEFFTPRSKLKDDSAYNFVERRFGKDAALFLISPMLCGICAGDAKEISIKSLFPSVFEAEQNYGSVIKGFFKKSITPEKIESKVFPDVHQWNCWTLKNGLSSIIDKLYESVKRHCTVSLNTSISKLDVRPGSVTCTINGKEHEFSHLISAIPASSLAELLSHQHPHLSKYLSQIFCVNVIVVNIIFEGQHLEQPAFGFLVPPSQNKSLLGIIYDSCILPQGNKTILTAMLGGRWYDKYFTSSTTDDEIKELTLSYIKSILGISQPPLSCHVSIHKNCIPQYVIGHSERLEKIYKYIEINNLPISLVGSSYKGVGINDVILSGKLVANELR